MRTVQNFSPTQFDHPIGVFGEFDDKQGWLIAPVSQTRDSGELDKSNFATALEMLGGESDTVEVHRFGHWGPGWYEVIVCHPKHTDRLEEIEASLADYPVLDEEDWSNREWEAYQECWQHSAGHDMAQEMQKAFGLSDSAFDLIDDASIEDQQEFFESLVPSGDYHNEECYPRIRGAVERCTRGQIAGFLKAQRKAQRKASKG